MTIPLDEYRDYAVGVLANWITGPTEPMSDGYQRRINIADVSPGLLSIHVEGTQYLDEEDRRIDFSIAAVELTASGELAGTTIPPVADEVEEEPAEAPAESEVVAQLREEVARLNRAIGEAESRHIAAMQAVQKSAADEVREHKAKLDLEHAQKKREEAKATAARSRTALVAKIAEHFAPLLAGFQYNFKDCRHVGELFDFLVFDGLEDGEIRDIVFLEVKSRKSGTRVTNPRERLLKKAIEEGRVRYEVYVPPVEVAKREPEV